MDPQSLGPRPLYTMSVVAAWFEGPKGSTALRDTGEMGFCLAKVGAWEGPCYKAEEPQESSGCRASRMARTINQAYRTRQVQKREAPARPRTPTCTQGGAGRTLWVRSGTPSTAEIRS